MKIAVILLALFYGATSSAPGNCSYNYTNQPPTSYPCNPYGVRIQLPCTLNPDAAETYGIDWYHTTDPASAASYTGTMLDISGEYSGFDGFHSNTLQLSFTVSNKTVGFYWCKVRASDARPSTIASICDADFYDNTSDVCELDDLRYTYSHRGAECGVEGSPVVFPRPSLPDNCIVPSAVGNMSSSHYLTSDVIGATPTSVTSTPTSTPTISSTSTFHTQYSSSTTSSTFLFTSSVVSASTSPSQSATQSNISVDTSSDHQTILLYTLIGVCGALAVIAVAILIVIVILCKLNNSHRSSYPASKSEEIEEEATWNNNGHVKMITYSHDEKVGNGLVNRDLSISNPNYEINVSYKCSSASPNKNTSGSTTPSSDYISPVPIYATATRSPPPFTTPIASPIQCEDYEELDVKPQPMYAVLEDPTVVNTHTTRVAIPDRPPKLSQAAPQSDDLYDTPWGALPTGIKRSMSRTKSQSSHPPSLTAFDDADDMAAGDDNTYSTIPT